jgi:hypothetical protein
MVDATCSPLGCAIWRVWAASASRERPLRGRSRDASASHRQNLTDATSIGDALPPRPRAASSRPDGGDPMASTI